MKIPQRWHGKHMWGAAIMWLFSTRRRGDYYCTVYTHTALVPFARWQLPDVHYCRVNNYDTKLSYNEYSIPNPVKSLA